MKITQFEELKIWQQSIKITKQIYDLSFKKEFSKDFALRDQIRRAAISISANIVEGFEKNNNNEFIRYLKIAKGSVGEVRSHLHIALTIVYITIKEFEDTNLQLEELGKQIGSFISYLTTNRRAGEFNRRTNSATR